MLSFEVIGGGGMRDAADRCMNIGLCRKTTGGVMCPSYQVTLQEEHSTRGRANALVKALSEPDPKAALGGERLNEILDLCLMCKACKSECPMSVDMASLKAETLHQHHEEHGTPLRSRIFGSIRFLNRLGSATAPLSNLPGRIGPLRKLMERAVGIKAERPLPKFVRDNLVRWNRRRATVPGTAGTVNWLADSFTTFTEPQIGKAAIELLESAGGAVELASGGCCGRSSLSKGLLDDAKKKATGLVTSLARDTEPGSPIVGCEPSCVFTLRDETLALLPEVPEAQQIKERVRQVEELLVEAIDDGRLKLPERSWLSGRRVVFHGHCHQKAEVGTAATMALLRRIPGLEVAEIDSGCCGMAGSFGFEAEHYETSMAVGRDRLFPALEKEPAATLVAATGVSCRQQIFHGAGRTAWHPLELVREALGGQA